MSEIDWLDTDDERGMTEYNRGYVQGRTDFAKEVMERIGCIEACDDDDYDMGVDWAVCEALRIINEMVGGSDGKE